MSFPQRLFTFANSFLIFRVLAQVIEHSGFQSAEAEIEGISARLGRPEFHRSRSISCRSREAIQNRPAGIPQAQKLRYLVVGFAGGIVPRTSELSIRKRRRFLLRGGLHLVQNRVATG